MKIYIEDEMIINTEQVKFFSVIKKTSRVFELVAFFVGNYFLPIKRSNDLYEIQDHFNNIMHHLFIGTEFLDLNLNEPYEDSDRRYYND